MKRRSSKWSGGRGTRAVALVLMALVGLAGCDSGALVAPGESGESPAPGENAGLAVEITPGSLTLAWIGATAELTASIRDAQGAEVSGTAVTWTSLDSEIAEVSSTGTVTAKAVGTALIVASCASCTLADTAEAQVYEIEAGDFAEAVKKWNAQFEKEWPDHYAASVRGGGFGYNYYDPIPAAYRRGYAAEAEELLKRYRDEYVIPNEGAVAPRWANPDGLAEHYRRTGDPESLRALGLVADGMARSTTWANNGSAYISKYEKFEGRIAERAILSALVPMALDVPSERGYDWEETARKALDMILPMQQEDGSWRTGKWNGESLNYMAALLCDALARYYTEFEPDPRIPDAVKRTVDWMWSTQWRPEDGGFNYASGEVEGVGGPRAAPDLNLLYVSSWGFVYQQTGDERYIQQGDIIFAEGVERAWFGGYKQFNQQFRSAHRYLEWRSK